MTLNVLLDIELNEILENEQYFISAQDHCKFYVVKKSNSSEDDYWDNTLIRIGILQASLEFMHSTNLEFDVLIFSSVRCMTATENELIYTRHRGDLRLHCLPLVMLLNFRLKSDAFVIDLTDYSPGTMDKVTTIFNELVNTIPTAKDGLAQQLVQRTIMIKREAGNYLGLHADVISNPERNGPIRQFMNRVFDCRIWEEALLNYDETHWLSLADDYIGIIKACVSYDLTVLMTRYSNVDHRKILKIASVDLESSTFNVQPRVEHNLRVFDALNYRIQDSPLFHVSNNSIASIKNSIARRILDAYREYRQNNLVPLYIHSDSVDPWLFEFTKALKNENKVNVKIVCSPELTEKIAPVWRNKDVLLYGNGDTHPLPIEVFNKGVNVLYYSYDPTDETTYLQEDASDEPSAINFVLKIG